VPRVKIKSEKLLDINEFRKIDYERLIDNYRYGKSLSLVSSLTGADHRLAALYLKSLPIARWAGILAYCFMVKKDIEAGRLIPPPYLNVFQRLLIVFTPN
jgi:hypothetical protein